MPKIFQRASSGFLALLESGKFSDLKIVVKNGDGTKIIAAHKNILAAGSSFFMNLLEADPKMDSVHLNERSDVVMDG